METSRVSLNHGGGGRKGQAAIAGYAEDYACLAFGLLELFEATGEASWLEWARDLQAQLDERFWDDVAAGWFCFAAAM